MASSPAPWRAAARAEAVRGALAEACGAPATTTT